MHSDLERIIALSGIHQAAHCVERIANRGSVDIEPMEPCIYSLFQIDAPDTAAVYGPPGAVATGARQVVAQLTGEPERNLELTRYVISLMRHERTLAQRPEMLRQIRFGIEVAEAKRQARPLLDPEVLNSLASVYTDTVSRLEPRIIVRGDERYLRNTENQDRIRALLLAGIRSAMLWRQIGGSRWQILFSRKRLLQAAREYLAAFR
jgi:high frequency lysogenization protein